MNRRQFIIGSGAAGGALLLPRPAAAHVATPHLPHGGVNTHLSFWNTPYSDAARMADKLLALETKLCRDSWAPPGQSSAWYDRWNQAVLRCRDVAGVKWVWYLPGGYTASQLNYYLDGMESAKAANVLAGIEPPNEPDLNGLSDAQIIEGQQMLYEAVKARPALRSYLVWGPATYKSTARRIGSLGAYMDVGGWHIYFRERPIDTWGFNDAYDAARTLSGGKRLIPTEANFIIGDGFPNLADRAGEREQLLGYEDMQTGFSQLGIDRVFCYELFNGSDPKFASTHRENNFGCFRSDGSAKPLSNAVLAANRRG